MVAVKRKDFTNFDLPVVYLDHNILDAFLKGKLTRLRNSLVQHSLVVYSNETLEEIKRAGLASPAYSDAFLSLLAELGAAHIAIVMDKNFRETNQVRISHGSPVEFYNQYCESVPEFDAVLESAKQLAFKISGGNQGDTLDDIANESIDAFEGLMEYLENLVEEFDKLDPVLAKHFRELSRQSVMDYRKLAKNNANLMAKNIVDEKNWSGIRDYREHMKIEPYHFNNIKAPRILEKICAILESSKMMPEGFNSPEKIFMFDRDEVIPGQPVHLHNKVSNAYNMLNTIGYYPDKPLHKDRGFKRATSDQTHVSIASFCNCFLTADERLYREFNSEVHHSLN